MSLLQEIKKEILDSRELCGDEKLCLIAFLCSPKITGLGELAKLMGVTVNQVQMTVRSLRMKGYLREAAVEDGKEEMEALRKFVTREQEGTKLIKAHVVAEGKTGDSSQSGDSPVSVETPHLTEFASASDRNGSSVRGRFLRDFEAANRRKQVLSSEQRRQSRKDIPLEQVVPTSGVEQVSASVTGGVGSRNRHIATMYKNSGSAKPSSSAGVRRNADLKHSRDSATKEKTTYKEDEVMAMMDEVISRQEASIILGFAGGDLDKVKTAYKRVQGTQIKDKVDALVNLLQA